jgi:hypothetical protein
MDDRRFDQWARMFGGRIGRRSVVAGVAGVLTGAVVAGPASANGIHRRVCRPVGAGCTRGGQCCSGICPTSRALPRAGRNRCACPAGETPCGGGCCGDGESCYAGVCRETCVSHEEEYGSHACSWDVQGVLHESCFVWYWNVEGETYDVVTARRWQTNADCYNFSANAWACGEGFAQCHCSVVVVGAYDGVGYTSSASVCADVGCPG